MEPFDYQVLGWGTPEGSYPGQFTPTVIEVIKDRVRGCSHILHLFSGGSKIGDVRVDLSHPNATVHKDIFDFIKENNDIWEYVILDPPYLVSEHKENDMDYKGRGALTANIPGVNAFKNWCNIHAKNILWLDYCAPIWDGFKRTKMWIFLPGGYMPPRILSELSNVNMITRRQTIDSYASQNNRAINADAPCEGARHDDEKASDKK